MNFNFYHRLGMMVNRNNFQNIRTLGGTGYAGCANYRAPKTIKSRKCT